MFEKQKASGRIPTGLILKILKGIFGRISRKISGKNPEGSSGKVHAATFGEIFRRISQGNLRETPKRISSGAIPRESSERISGKALGRMEELPELIFEKLRMLTVELSVDFFNTT